MDIFEACEKGDYNRVKDLISTRIDLNQVHTKEELYPLHIAALKGHLNIVELLLKHGANVNLKSPLVEWTPLYFAIYSQRIEIVDLLIKHGSIINDKTNYRWTPLCYAMHVGESNIAELLILHGADFEDQPILQLAPYVSSCKETLDEIIQRVNSYKRSSKRSCITIQKYCIETLYKPDGLGYQKARDHFYSLVQ